MQSSGQLHILIADDHELVRRGIRKLLSSRAGLLICAEAATGREAIMLAQKHHPDIAVIDISMPELNGLEAIRKLHKMLPKMEIAVFSLHYSDQLVRDAVEAGARAYVLKSDADRDLLLAVEALANHGSFFTPSVAEIFMNVFLRNDSDSSRLGDKRLTSREREIVQLLAEGRGSKGVAKMLGISTHTAEKHRSNLMQKLQLHSVVELVHYAVKNSIIEP